MGARFRALEAGEPIAVAALSGPVRRERLDAGLRVLETWGHEILRAPNLLTDRDYLAGSDDERREGLRSVLDDGARVVIAARGGYGVSRIVDSIDFKELVDEDRCFVGFSDLTALIHPLASAGAVQVHGPMVACGLDRPENAERLRRILNGKLEGRDLFRFGSRSVLRHGRVTGPALGGNLTMLNSLIGGPREPDLEGTVLFVEEVAEAPYRLDRLLTQLRRSGRLNGVKALMCGSLHRCGRAAERNRIWPRLVLDSVPETTVVVTGLSFGHGARNLAFPLGAEVEVDTRTGRVSWI